MKIGKLKRLILIGLTLAITGVIGCSISNSIKNTNERQQYTNTITVNDTKTLEAESVVESVTELGNLEVLQLNISKDVKIKKGEFFKKEQDIKFKALVKFKIDLTKIDSNNVIIQDNTIKLFISQPIIDIEFLEGETEFGEVNKSFMTFGDIEFTAEEFESLKSELKNNIYQESLSEMQTAKDKVNKVLETSLLALTKSEYKVVVNYVE